MDIKHLKYAIDFLSVFDINLRFVKKGGSGAFMHNRTISLDVNELVNVETTWSIIFHELAHIYCYDNNIYVNYHHDTWSNAKMHRYGFKVERGVDNIAKKLMNIYLPDLTYIDVYDTIESRIWYKQWLNRNYPI